MQKLLFVMALVIFSYKANNIEELQKEVENLKKEVASLNERQHPKANDNCENKKSKINEKLNIKGYAKFTVLNDMSEIGEKFNRDYSYAVQLLYKDDPSAVYGHETRMHLKESRIKLNYNDTINLFERDIPVAIFMAFDFYNGKEGNGLFTHSHQPRIRSASVDIGNFRIGLDWTLFMDLENFPQALDFGNSTGVALLRQPKIQYNYKVNDNLVIAAALENPDSAYIKKDGAKTFSFTLGGDGSKLSNAAMPDFIVAMRYKDEKINTSLRGVITHARTFEVGKKIEKYGGGIGWSLGYNFCNKDKFLTHITFGKGMGRYLHDTADSGFFLDTDTKTMHRHKVLGLAASYRHFWKEDLCSNINLGFTKINLHNNILNQPNPTAALDGNRAFKFFDHITTMHTNLIWKPRNNFEMGVEYFHTHKFRAKFAHLTNTPKLNGFTDRIILSVKVNF